jgi:hypothetical protein
MIDSDLQKESTEFNEQSTNSNQKKKNKDNSLVNTIIEMKVLLNTNLSDSLSEVT